MLRGQYPLNDPHKLVGQNEKIGEETRTLELVDIFSQGFITIDYLG